MILDPIAAWRKVKPFVPPELYRYAAVAYRAYAGALCWYHEQLRDPPGPDGFPLPPARLRHRVIGVANARAFGESIPKVREDFERALAHVGRSLDTATAVLDFGAGCGRGLRAFHDERGGRRLYGSDIDEEAIRWCQSNLPIASWSVNGELPPLPFPEGMFDLVYSISVFTHLDARHMFAWLAELRRVTRPEAVVLLTVHGEASWRNLPRRAREIIIRDGFLYLPTYADKGRFPDWYQNAYHSEWYVRREFARYFDVLDYQADVIYGQDLVVLRRRSD
jgi:SAM-dependent methyltransferase